MKAYGICPASCGEFVQGILENEECLCSYAVDIYSKIILEERLDNIQTGPHKSRMAIKSVFKRFGIPIRESKSISLQINSDIPLGKGMASSTADIGATIKATLKLINKNLSNEEISKLAVKIEPTDSIYLDKNSIFNPTTGEVIKTLGNIENGRVIVLEPKKTISTKRIRSIPYYMEKKRSNTEMIKMSFDLLEKGIKENNLKLIGRASTISSLANENIHKKHGLDKIIEISDSYGAYGVNVAHSGTVVGIIIDRDMNEKKIIEKIHESKISSFYNKIYTSNIINGGLKGEIEWNTSKIL
ncbi:MAG: cobalamin biosynthesis protein [Romboutsia sp.]|uniref:GHMP family kinase ATP-binding protein n=1 Tax=Romboutsia sp. TaxID=1965302 RepID=UPI003F2D8884